MIEKYGIILEGIFEQGEMRWGTVYTYNREGMICTQTGCMRQKRNEGETVVKVYNKSGKLQESYEGGMAQGLKSGYGVQRYLDGSRYEGNWKMGKQSGQGKYFYASGARYEGSWVNGQSQGSGTYYYTNGARYEGEWARDKKQGLGTYYFTNGDREVGHYVESKSEGEHKYYGKDN